MSVLQGLGPRQARLLLVGQNIHLLAHGIRRIRLHAHCLVGHDKRIHGLRDEAELSKSGLPSEERVNFSQADKGWRGGEKD